MLLPRLVLTGILLQLCTLCLYAGEEFPAGAAKRKQTSQYHRLFADSSFLAMRDSLGRAIKRKDNMAVAYCFKQMGRICYHLGHYPQALDFYLQAGKIFRQEGKRLLEAENMNDIGSLYLSNRQPRLARQQYDEALAIYTASRNSAGTALTYGKIGHLYEKQHRYDSAFYYQHKALSQYLQANDRAGMARIYENLGSIYEDLKKYDSAYHYFQRSLLLNQQAGDTISSIEVLNNLGDILRKTGRYREGLVQTRHALAQALRSQEQFHLGSVYRDMAKTYHLMGNNDSAYYYQELGRRLLLNIYTRESGTQIALLQTMYDMEKKNNEIERLRNARKASVAVVIVGLLLALTGILVISRQWLKIKNAHLLNEQERHVYQSQKALMELQEQTLKQELEVRSKALSTHTLHIIQKNQLLETLHNQLDEMVKDGRRDQKKQLRQLQLQIHQNFNRDQHWDEFHGIFGQVHQTFFEKLRTYCETLTSNDLRLISLLKMNLDSNEIAALLGISQDSLRVVRYRLRKKLNLQQGESLTIFLQSL